MKGNKAEAMVLDNYLNAPRNKVYAYEREMILDRMEITYQYFKEKWYGLDKQKKDDFGNI